MMRTLSAVRAIAVMCLVLMACGGPDAPDDLHDVQACIPEHDTFVACEKACNVADPGGEPAFCDTEGHVSGCSFIFETSGGVRGCCVDEGDDTLRFRECVD